MTDFIHKIEALSPEKRQLLFHRLHQAGHQVNVFPLSFAQRRLWFLAQLDPDSPVYNLPVALHMRGPLQPDALERSLNAIVQRHAILRARLLPAGEEPLQVIMPDQQVALVVSDFDADSATWRESQAQAYLRAEARRPFDVANEPLLRAHLLRLAEQDHILLILLHHCIADGGSVILLLEELKAAYQAFAADQAWAPPELPIQYTDFTLWQHEQLQPQRLAPALAYWQQQLHAPLPVLEFPSDHPRPAVPSSQGATYTFTFSPQLREDLEQFSSYTGVTLFMTLLAAFQVVLFRYTGQTDLTVGSPISGRSRPETRRLIGLFINTLVLRTDLSGNPTFRELLSRVRKTCLGAYAHQQLPFDQLVEAVHPERTLNHTPLFQTLFAFLEIPDKPLDFPGLEVSLLPVDSGTAKFDVSLYLTTGTAPGLSGSLEYRTDLFEEQTMARLVGHFQTVLESILANPEQRLSALPLLTRHEQQQLLVWNATQTDYPRTQQLHELFEAQVRATPNATAVCYEGTDWTYQELNRRANQLAYYLRRHGVGPEVLVAICVERSLEMLVGLLGILKAGGAYVPLDPAYPQDRLAFMLTDAQVPVLVTQAPLVPHLPQHTAQIVCLDTDWPTIEQEDQENPPWRGTAQDLAYVIYTSGSTGKPKGVQIPHQALINLLIAMSRQPGLTSQDVLLAVTSLSFDIAALELFLPLLVGARLIVANRDVATDGVQLAATLDSSGTTLMQATPSTWRMLLDAGWRGNAQVRMLCGGEALPPALAKQLLEKGRELWNVYGPTETTIWSTVCKVEADARVSIGRPLANTEVHVLDQSLQPVPIGVAGELYIGGDGLARGYLHRPELTAEKFIRHPFSPVPGARLYKTGDLVRYLPDGKIEFLGRLDHQVKLRGYRIELGEIEAVLDRHPAVQNVVAVCREDEPNNQQLVAYVELDTRAPAAVFIPEAHDNSPDFDRSQLGKWQTVWDQTYQSDESPARSALDLSGWLSSYTGNPIPEAEMQEWVATTVERILALKPRRVLEIGCGTGLLLSRIAPQVDAYVGTDFSAAVLERLHERVRAWGLNGVQLLHREAVAFDPSQQHAFDTVIVNSVMQYFPGLDYLVQVLEGAVKAVADGGAIFLGDIRALPLLELQHASVQFAQAAETCSRAELRRRVTSQTDREEELVLAPALFPALQARLPRIQQVAVLLKRGRAANEMTKFRYDVVLHIGASTAAPHAPIPVDTPCIDAGRQMSIHDVHTSLTDLISPPGQGPAMILVRNLLNHRLQADVQILDWLRSRSGPETVGQLRNQLQKEPAPGISPEEVWALGEALGYAVSLGWATEEPLRRFEAVFSRPGAPAVGIGLPVSPANSTAALPLEQYANDPVRGARRRALVSELRQRLEAQLPAYMVPSAIICLDQLPLTPNGKIDRKALPVPDQVRPDLAQTYVAPHTPEEKAIAQIWQQVLGIEQIGIHDNFFELGGHSLQTVQIVSKISAAFDQRLPVKWLFLYPTIASLAEALRTHKAHENEHARQNELPQNDSAKRPSAQATQTTQVTIEHRPLLSLFATGQLAPVQAAAIASLPDTLLDYTGLSADDILHNWCQDMPLFQGVYEMTLGRIGLLLIPQFSSQLYHDQPALLDRLVEALTMAKALGAETVSLTGLLPSATDYGRAVAERIGDRQGYELPRLTTGHATTAATVVLSIRRIVAEAGRDMPQERVGVLGLGSIGIATLRLMLSSLPHPSQLILCDVHEKQSYLETLRQELINDLHFSGTVHIVDAQATIPPAFYNATLIIGASNVPDILDIHQIQPGTLIVDDSAPHCLSAVAAMRRFQDRADLLFTEGGVLRAPAQIRRQFYLPRQAASQVDLSAFTQVDPYEITGCIFSSLLSARFAHLPPTVGLADTATSRQHYEQLEQLAFQAARLHYEGHVLETRAIERFRQRFGHSLAPASLCSSEGYVV